MGDGPPPPPPGRLLHALHLNAFWIWWILDCGIPTQTGWKREWQDEHSSSGIPVTPGQKGEQGEKLDTLFLTRPGGVLVLFCICLTAA